MVDDGAKRGVEPRAVAAAGEDTDPFPSHMAPLCCLPAVPRGDGGTSQDNAILLQWWRERNQGLVIFDGRQGGHTQAARRGEAGA